MYPNADGKDMEAKKLRGEMAVNAAWATRNVGTSLYTMTTFQIWRSHDKEVQRKHENLTYEPTFSKNVYS